MVLFNPTGGVIRKDPAGDGHFGALRGERKHVGLDLTIPSNNVWSPITGRITRKAYPYANALEWEGCYIVGTGRDSTFNCKLFYCVVDSDLLGTIVSRGQRIATPQKISEKYPGQGMIDHVHLEVEVNPYRVILQDMMWNGRMIYFNPAVLLGLNDNE